MISLKDMQTVFFLRLPFSVHGKPKILKLFRIFEALLPIKMSGDIAKPFSGDRNDLKPNSGVRALAVLEMKIIADSPITPGSGGRDLAAAEHRD